MILNSGAGELDECGLNRVLCGTEMYGFVFSGIYLVDTPQKFLCKNEPNRLSAVGNAK